MNSPSAPPCSPGSLPALWLGWLVAPFWWLLQFEARYALVPWACAHGQRWAVLGFGAVALTISAVLAARAWRWRRPAAGRNTTTFLQLGAAWSATFFAFVVLVQMLPDFFLDPCRI